jgi:hypothetical protein
MSALRVERTFPISPLILEATIAIDQWIVGLNWVVFEWPGGAATP